MHVQQNNLKIFSKNNFLQHIAYWSIKQKILSYIFTLIIIIFYPCYEYYYFHTLNKQLNMQKIFLEKKLTQKQKYDSDLVKSISSHSIHISNQHFLRSMDHELQILLDQHLSVIVQKSWYIKNNVIYLQLNFISSFKKIFSILQNLLTTTYSITSVSIEKILHDKSSLKANITLLIHKGNDNDDYYEKDSTNEN